MAAATSHMSDRTLSMDALALPSAPTVSETTVDGASTTSPGGGARRGAVGGDGGDQRLAPGDRLLHRSQRHVDEGDPTVHAAAVDHPDHLVPVPAELELTADVRLHLGVDHRLVGPGEPVARDHLRVPQPARLHPHQVDRLGAGAPRDEDDLFRREQHCGRTVHTWLVRHGALGGRGKGCERGEPAVRGG